MSEVKERQRLNPIVKDILETAAETAKPHWVGITQSEVEIFERKAIWMVQTDHNVYTNGNSVKWETSHQITVHGIALAKDRNSAPFKTGPLHVVRFMNPGDTLMIAEGAIIYNGDLYADTK